MFYVIVPWRLAADHADGWLPGELFASEDEARAEVARLVDFYEAKDPHVWRWLVGEVTILSDQETPT